MTLLSDCYASQFHFFYETGGVFIPYCLYKCKQRNRVRIEKKTKETKKETQKTKNKTQAMQKGFSIFRGDVCACSLLDAEAGRVLS